MEGAGDGLVAEHRDHSSDLPPAAEVDDVADVPARARPPGGLRAGMIAEALDKLARVGQGKPAGEMNVVAQLLPPGISVFSRASCLAGERWHLLKGQG